MTVDAEANGTLRCIYRLCMPGVEFGGVPARVCRGIPGGVRTRLIIGATEPHELKGESTNKTPLSDDRSAVILWPAFAMLGAAMRSCACAQPLSGAINPSGRSRLSRYRGQNGPRGRQQAHSKVREPGQYFALAPKRKRHTQRVPDLFTGVQRAPKSLPAEASASSMSSIGRSRSPSSKSR